MILPRTRAAARRQLMTVNQDEFYNLFRYLIDKHPDAAMTAALCFFLGLRIGEAHSLTWDNVQDLGSKSATILITEDNSKTGRARQLPIPQELKTLLRFAHSIRPLGQLPFPGTANYVIVGRTGHHPTIRWLQITIAKASRKAIDRKVRAHELRHSFATRLLRVTNTRVLQIALGHAALSSTQIYTHPTMNDLQTAIEAAANLATP